MKYIDKCTNYAEDYINAIGPYEKMLSEENPNLDELKKLETARDTARGKYFELIAKYSKIDPLTEIED